MMISHDHESSSVLLNGPARAARRAQGSTEETDEWFPRTVAEQADYLMATHHAHLTRQLPRLVGLARTPNPPGLLCWTPEFQGLLGAFEDLLEPLKRHLVTEEREVYTRIRQLEHDPRSCGIFEAIRAAHEEHEALSEALRALEARAQAVRDLTERLPAPALLMTGVDQLGTDLRRLIHIEEALLFPQALNAEEPRGARGRTSQRVS